MGVIVYPRIGNHNGLPLFRYQSPKTSSQIKRPKQSISRILFRVQVTLNRATIIHLRMPIARHLLRPTRELGRAALERSSIWSCTGWGLPSFPGHPGNWCALTAPFHPYPTSSRRTGKSPGGILSVALSFALPRLHVMKHPALRCSDFPPDQNLIQRSSGLLRPFILILPVNDSLTAGTIFQAVAPMKFIVHLGRDIHVTALADGVFNFHDSNPIPLFHQLAFKDIQQLSIKRCSDRIPI